MRSGGEVGRAGAPQRKTAQNHVRGVDRDAGVVLVAHVNRRPAPIINTPGAGRAGRGDGERSFPFSHADGLADREIFAPCRGGKSEVVDVRPASIGFRKWWPAEMDDAAAVVRQVLVGLGNGVVRAAFFPSGVPRRR